MTHHLQAVDLVKSYKGRKIVNQVSLSMHSGEIVGLLGPNGAGKTTSFYIIVGLIHADAGQVLFDEHDITAMPMHKRARLGMGYLPQEASVFRKLSVEDNIRAILQLRRDLDRQQREAKLNSLLEELQITGIRKNPGISLSGGERRRVEIARSLAIEPYFILLDEPFAGVDPLSVGEIQKIVRLLSEKDIGVLITDHSVRETLGICQRAYIMNNGQVIAEGAPETLLADERVKTVYLGQDFRL